MFNKKNITVKIRFIFLRKLGVQKGAGDQRRSLIPIRVRLERWLHRRRVRPEAVRLLDKGRNGQQYFPMGIPQ